MMMKVKDEKIKSGKSKDYGSYFNGLGRLSSLQEEYHKKFGGSSLKFIQEYQKVANENSRYSTRRHICI